MIASNAAATAAGVVGTLVVFIVAGAMIVMMTRSAAIGIGNFLKQYWKPAIWWFLMPAALGFWGASAADTRLPVAFIWAGVAGILGEFGLAYAKRYG